MFEPSPTEIGAPNRHHNTPSSEIPILETRISFDHLRHGNESLKPVASLGCMVAGLLQLSQQPRLVVYRYILELRRGSGLGGRVFDVGDS